MIQITEYENKKIVSQHTFMAAYETYIFLCKALEGSEYSSNIDWTESIPNTCYICDYNEKHLYTIEYTP